MPTYAELRLRIDRGVAHGSYRIVATGPAGEALGRFKLPFSDLELENFILRIGTTRRGRRRIDSPEMELAKTFGTKLFGALFEGDVRELYRSSFAESRAEGRGLRVTLSLTGAPELLQVPWEYLYDHPSFLSISTWTPIVRYLDLPKPRRPLQIELPLRILALVSAPSDFEAIDAAQERSKLESALAPLIDAGAIAIDWLEEASLRSLQRQLRKADYHVFHYIGHGGYDDDADDGVLLFEDEGGRGRRVSGVQLGTILADEVSLRLAVLNSCEGGRSSLQDPFSGVATSLIEREIPAVIGMQFEITDRAAIVFGGEFYAALADGLAVDSAVAEARKAIYADENDIEWGTPVLFMRVADGRLFDVTAHAPVRPAAQGVEATETDDSAVAGALAEAQAVEHERVGEAERMAAAERVAEAERVEQARVQREAGEAEAAAETERKLLAEADAAAEAERLERELVEQETAEAARAAAVAEAERAEAERVEAERVEQERVEADRVQRQSAELAERGRAAVTVPAAQAEASAPVDQSLVAPGRAATAAVSESSLVDAASKAPLRLGRTAGRAAVGSLAGISLVWVWAYLVYPDLFTGSFEDISGWFATEAVITVIAITAAVTAVEAVWPSVRVPGGSVYRLVGGNRWVAAGIEGAVAGATVGWLATIALYAIAMPEQQQLTPDVAILHSSLTAVGFVFAEGVIALLIPRSTGEATVRSGVSAPPETSGASPALSAIPQDGLRAAGRGALGGVLAVILAFVLVFIPTEYYNGLRAMFGGLFGDSLWMAVALGVTASVAEGLWPAVRVPAGSAYRWVGGNRWAAAAIQGAVIGATAGFLVMILQHSSWLAPDRAIQSAVITAVSFVAAEAVLVWVARRRQGQRAT